MAGIDPHHALLWQKQLAKLKKHFGKTPDLNALLFLIGIQELGQGFRPFSKEEKQDLMSLAICRLLEPLGYYVFEGLDTDGWPHYKLIEALPQMSLQEQEYLLQQQIIDYLKDVDVLGV